MPGHDHQQHAKRHDDHVGVLQKKIGDILRRQEIDIQHYAHDNGEKRDDGNQRHQHSVFTQMPAQMRAHAFFFSHHATFSAFVDPASAVTSFFKINAMMRSWLASARVNSPIILPSFIT